jgi:hypothetical protein
MSELDDAIIEKKCSHDPVDNLDVGDTNLLHKAKILVKERYRRQLYFSEVSFCEPTWDILIDLFIAHMSCKKVSVSSACIASGVPSSTALRYLLHLTEGKIINRVTDPEDGRRVYVELSAGGIQSMKDYLRAEVCGRA